MELHVLVQQDILIIQVQFKYVFFVKVLSSFVFHVLTIRVFLKVFNVLIVVQIEQYIIIYANVEIKIQEIPFKFQTYVSTILDVWTHLGIQIHLYVVLVILLETLSLKIILIVHANLDFLMMCTKIMMLANLYVALVMLRPIPIVLYVMIIILFKLMVALIIVRWGQDGYVLLLQGQQALHFVSKNLL